MKIHMLAASAFLCVAGVTGFSLKDPRASAPKSAVEKTRPPSSPFVEWPSPMIVHDGDHAKLNFLEKIIGGPLYEKQENLPSLPVPSLEETIEKFLSSALPLAKNDQEKKELLEAAHTFPEEAKVLNERLLQKAADSKETSWLQQWWQQLGYLQGRVPLNLITYFLWVPDDKTLPQAKYSKSITRSAAMMVALANARKAVCSGAMPFESMSYDGKGEAEPLCSAGFKFLFHTCRVPQEGQDAYHLYDPSLHKHCIVASRGQFYAFDFVDDEGEPLALSVLEEKLQHCVLESQTANKEWPEMGYLTTADRDTWTAARSKLLDEGGDNMAAALEKMESAAFVLNLDDVVSSDST
jgi:carnitine O-acetyltransferase